MRLQKKLEESAKPRLFKERSTFYEGVLDFAEFARNYDLRCYEPSPDLAPFVEHYFISRRRHDFNPDYIGEDILSQPVASIFFTPIKSFIQGPSTSTRRLVAKTSPLYIGVQFKPGGFYAFWQRNMNKLAEKTVPTTELIPQANPAFVHKLLLQDDQLLLKSMEALLRFKAPQIYPHLHIVEKISLYIEESCTTATVATVAKHFGMSDRSLQHVFQKYVGVGAKWTIMRARFLEIIKFARQQENLDWAIVATEFGYSDQSHLINDFKKIVGISPRRYEAALHRSRKLVYPT